MSYTTPPQKWQIKQKFKHFLKKTHQNPEVSDLEMAVFNLTHLLLPVLI